LDLGVPHNGVSLKTSVNAPLTWLKR
jgi:hypothetical protein